MNWIFIVIACVLIVLSLFEAIAVMKAVHDFEMKCLSIQIDITLARNNILSLQDRVNKIEAWMEEHK